MVAQEGDPPEPEPPPVQRDLFTPGDAEQTGPVPKYTIGRPTNTVLGWAYDLFLWLVTPAADVLLKAMDSLGIRDDFLVYVDFSTGPVAYAAGVIDAWVPLHEAIDYMGKLILVMAIILPVKFMFKLIPGLG